MSLSREELLQKRGGDLGRIIEVSVPEWGGTVNLRPMKVGERDRLSAWAVKPENQNSTEIRKRLLSICLCDEKGERLFQDNQIADMDGFSDVVIDRLFLEAQKICGVLESADGLEKNSEATTKGDSDLS